MRILYIVRTFGPVGGMERYVFETAREMVRRGHQVTVLCVATGTPETSSSGVHIISLDQKRSTRGWQHRHFFRNSVTDFFSDPANRARFDIIHSHENTLEQDVTTEHGPCTALGLRLKPWKHLDFSARKNLMIERQKFHGPHLKALVSCSQRVHEIVVREYPHLGSKVTEVITPAHTYMQPIAKDPTRPFRVLGFMGRDWKRKGLPKALEVFKLMRAQNPLWSMLVAGCPRESLPSNLFRKLPDGAQILGRSDPQEFFSKIDVLVHPALDEPFGMVVSEALSCGVPVIVSDQCGATAHLTSKNLCVLPAEAPDLEWAKACSALAGQTCPPLATRTWSDVAGDHESLYQRILGKDWGDSGNSSANSCSACPAVAWL